MNLIGSQPSREWATVRTVLLGKGFFYVHTQSSSQMLIPLATQIFAASDE
jgi:hypothetical protein